MNRKVHYPQNLPVCYTADLHLKHSNILLYCRRTEFMTAAEREMVDAWDGSFPKPRISSETVRRHDDAILSVINSAVPKDGVLVIVGDFCWSKDIAVAGRFRDAIQCQYVHLILGNHDSHNIVNLFTWWNEKTTVLVPHNDERFHGASKVVLDHEAHFTWDGRHYGSRHYYGHSHAMIEDQLDEMMPGRFSQDVGIDNAFRLTGQYRPFSDKELEEKMKTRSGYGILRK